MTKSRLTIKPRPDAFGFLYGEVVIGDVVHRLNIMPPAHEWQGDIMLEGFAPHATDWVVYVDGEELARVRSCDDVEATVLPLLGNA